MLYEQERKSSVQREVLTNESTAVMCNCLSYSESYAVNNAYMRVRSGLVGLCIPLLSCAIIAAEDKQIPLEETRSGFLRFRFGAYEIDRIPEKSTFQITIVGRKNASWFLKVGDSIPGTKYVLHDFVQKTVPGEREDRNVPELILTNIEAGTQVVLPMNIVKEVPLSPGKKQE